MSPGACPTAHNLTGLYDQILSDVVEIGRNPRVACNDDLTSKIAMAVSGLRLWAQDEEYERRRWRESNANSGAFSGPAMLYLLDDSQIRAREAAHESSWNPPPSRQKSKERHIGRGSRSCAYNAGESSKSAQARPKDSSRDSDPEESGFNHDCEDAIAHTREKLESILMTLPKFIETHDDGHIHAHQKLQAAHLCETVRTLFAELPAIDQLLDQNPKRNGKSSLRERTYEDNDPASRPPSLKSDNPSSPQSIGPPSARGKIHPPQTSSPRQKSLRYVSRDGALLEVDGLDPDKGTTFILRTRAPTRHSSHRSHHKSKRHSRAQEARPTNSGDEERRDQPDSGRRHRRRHTTGSHVSQNSGGCEIS